MHTLAISIYVVVSYLFFIGQYTILSGIGGPILNVFTLTLFFLIIITNPKTHIYWLILHSITGTGLLMMEYFHPNLINEVYNSEFEHFFDIGFKHFMTLLFMYFIASFVMRTYITEKKLAVHQTESAKQMNSELEHVNSDKSKLLSIIGHDLRGPLNSIASFFEMIDFDDLTVEERDQFIDRIKVLTNNSIHLLDNLLNWASFDSKSAELETINVQEILLDTVNLIEAVASKKEIKIKLTSSAKYNAIADAQMLQTVVRNLLGNAIKFSHPGGIIEVQSTNHLGAIFIKVKDYGIGIPEDRKQGIFSSFVKSTPGTDSETGVGLGLVLCSDFIKAMNGSISFTSTENLGTEFVLKLPQG